MAHAYRIRAETPPDTSTDTLRQQALAELDAYQRTLIDQEDAVVEMPADPLTDRPAHLKAVLRFAEETATRDTITQTATQMLDALPVSWWVLEYHSCPADEQATSGSDCPDWTREVTGGTPPEVFR
jgi:hypothetical protein